MTEPMWLASCNIEGMLICEWSQLAPKEEFAKVLMVMHAVVKHPKEYHEITGKDPEAMAFTYREYLEAVKAMI